MGLLSPLQFWNRLDDARDGSIKEVAEVSGIRYDRLLHNRSDCRYPKAEDIIKICESLDLSADYLLFGDTRVSRRAARLFRPLALADEATLEKVETLLGVRKKT